MPRSVPVAVLVASLGTTLASPKSKTLTRVTQPREGLGLTIEARSSVPVVVACVREYLECDHAVEPVVRRGRHQPHAAGADPAGDFVRAKTTACGETHGCTRFRLSGDAANTPRVTGM